jgi:isopenicillin-N epimerase
MRALKDVEKAPKAFYAYDYSKEWAKACAAVAHRFAVRAEDLTLVSNATDGINAVLRSLLFRQDNEILITSLTYGAIANAARHIIARVNGRVSVAPFQFPNPDPKQCIDALKSAITPKTKLVILDHITSGTGLVLPLAEMIEACHERNVPVLVDGAHAPGQIPLNIEALNADWYVANLHKWYFVPRGCGFLWARHDRQRGLVPTVLSWDIDKPFPHSFEWTGTREAASWLSIPTAFAFMDRFLLDKVIHYNHDLLREARHMIAEAWKVPVPSPDNMAANMGLLPLPAGLPFPATDEGRTAFQQALWDQHKICACASLAQDKRIWIRLSAQIYNEMADYEKLAKAVLAMR